MGSALPLVPVVLLLSAGVSSVARAWERAVSFCDVLHAGLGAADGCGDRGATSRGHQVPLTQGHFSCRGVGLGKDLQPSNAGPAERK